MSNLEKYVKAVNWTESVRQHETAIIQMHKQDIKSLESQLAEVREYMEEHDCLEDFNEWKNR